MRQPPVGGEWMCDRLGGGHLGVGRVGWTLWEADAETDDCTGSLGTRALRGEGEKRDLRGVPRPPTARSPEESCAGWKWPGLRTASWLSPWWGHPRPARSWLKSRGWPVSCQPRSVS